MSFELEISKMRVKKTLREGKVTNTKRSIKEADEVGIEKVFDLHTEEDDPIVDQEIKKITEDEFVLGDEDEELSLGEEEEEFDYEKVTEEEDPKAMKLGEEDCPEDMEEEEDMACDKPKLEEEDEVAPEVKKPVAEDSDEELLKALGEEDEEVKELPKEVSENIRKIFEGQNLTKEFKNKVISIFEATVNARTRKIQESTKRKALAVIKEQRLKAKESMVNSVDRYMTHLAKAWFKENRIAVVDSITLELSEGMMNSVKGILSQYNVRVPRSKENLVERLSGRVNALEKKLDEQMNLNIKLQENLGKTAKKQYIRTFTEGMSGTDKEKFVELAEEVSFTDEKSYRIKLKSIKEGLFSNTKRTKAEDFASKMLATEDKKVVEKPVEQSDEIARFAAILENGK